MNKGPIIPSPSFYTKIHSNAAVASALKKYIRLREGAYTLSFPSSESSEVVRIDIIIILHPSKL